MSMAPSDTSAEPVMAADTTEPPVDAKPVHPLAEYIELGKTIAYALFIALVLRIVLFQPYTIPSASMEPTLREGDYIIVSKYAYGWSKHSIPFSPPLFKGRIFAHQPRRGDIVVFKLPNDNKTDFIKRLIALPGDTIQVKHGFRSPTRTGALPARPRLQEIHHLFPQPRHRCGEYRRLHRAAGLLFHDGRQPGQLAGQPLPVGRVLLSKRVGAAVPECGTAGRGLRAGRKSGRQGRDHPVLVEARRLAV
jgi:signal peptidase I